MAHADLRNLSRRGALELLAGGALGALAGCGGREEHPNEASAGRAGSVGSGGSGGSGAAGSGGAAGGGGSNGGTAGAGASGGSAGSGGGSDSGLICGPNGPTPGCLITNDNILGPFYKADAPFNTELAAGVATGQRLIVTGTVYGCDCTTPLAGALVDIWQADDSGAYDSVGFLLRGRMLTDAAGAYQFSSVLPGFYLNGTMYRPRHIHYKVSHADGVALTTQLYFEGDEFLAADPFVKPGLAMPLSQEPAPDGGMILRCRFDVVLAGA
jgi:catechol 1,2-dioxygenase